MRVGAPERGQNDRPVNGSEAPADQSTVELTAAQRIAHAAVLDSNPDAHPADCAVCAQIKQENSVTEPNPELEAIKAELAAANAARDAAVAEAAGLKASQAAASVDEAVAAAVAAKDTELDGVNAKLVAETNRADAAEQALETYKTETAAAAEAAAAEAALAEVKDARVAALAGLLPDERIEARADFYAGLPEDAWTETLADIKANAKQEVLPTAGRIAGASAAVSLGGSTPPPPPAQAAAADGAPLTGAGATKALLARRRELAKLS